MDPHDLAAADALREGRIADALAALDAAGHLHVVADELDLRLEVLERWWQAHQAGTEHRMVDRQNHTRSQLNRLAHRLLQVTGEVGSEEIVASGDRRFSVGDRVMARTPGRDFYPPGRRADYVRNGAVGTVIALDRHGNYKRDTMRVRFDGIGVVALPRSFFDESQRRDGRRVVGLDHAYAATSYGVQGDTFNESTSRIDEKASRPEAYVDVTRGRFANHLYLTRAIDPLDGEHLPKAPPPPITASVTTRLTSSGPERAAVEVDPAAPAAAAARTGRDFAELCQGTDADERVGAFPVAEELRARQVARLGVRSLDRSVVDRLPPRSHLPFLAKQWDNTVADLSVFRSRRKVGRGARGRWEWALGPRADMTGLDVDRRRVAGAIVDLSVATVRESARAAGYELPDWAAAHIAYLAGRGACRHRLEELRSLYERIEAYRASAGVASCPNPTHAEEAIFGAPPNDPSLRMKRRALVQETLHRAAPMRRTAPGRISA